MVTFRYAWWSCSSWGSLYLCMIFLNFVSSFSFPLFNSSFPLFMKICFHFNPFSHFFLFFSFPSPSFLMLSFCFTVSIIQFVSYFQLILLSYFCFLLSVNHTRKTMQYLQVVWFISLKYMVPGCIHLAINVSLILLYG